MSLDDLTNDPYNDLEGLRSIDLNYLNNVKVRCTKFEVSIFMSFKTIENKTNSLLDSE